MSLYKYERVADIVRTRIISGDYPIGMKLKTILEFAAEFDTTTVTVTRALHILVAHNYITVKRGEGIIVIGNAPRSPLPEIRLALEESRTSLNRAFEILAQLEEEIT